ncbi:MAG: aconitase family protein [Liquorilactobacillus sp.]|uniref:aconitase family protein n=1 Tax=Liquorilactobacillus TaxID=2767888 RepID=UPI0039E8AC19
MTQIEKIMGSKQGEQAEITPNIIVLNDYSEIDSILNKIKAVNDNKQLKIFIDQDVPSGDPRTSELFGELTKFSKKYQIDFIQAKGIGYSYLLNEISSDQVVVSLGQHNSIYAAKHSLGLNLQPDDFIQAIETGHFAMTVPETYTIKLTGKLSNDLDVRDVYINLLSKLKRKDTEGKVLEIGGTYLDSLSESQRGAFFSMMARKGAVTAVWNEKLSVADMEFDLAGVQSLLVLPTTTSTTNSPYVAAPMSILEDVDFNAGMIGGYTGGDIDSLRLAAKLIGDHQHVAFGFRLNICPATSQDYLLALKEGLVSKFIDYGAQMIAPGDKNIVAQGAGAAGPGERILTVGSYTFSNCLGSSDANVYVSDMKTLIEVSLRERRQFK